MTNNQPVKQFYERNTRHFLLWGGGRAAGVMHREVWGAGVRSRTEALHYSHHLLLERLACLEEPAPHVLDLGCGVGSSLFHLCRYAERPMRGTGISISPRQVAEATRRTRQYALPCQFVEADFACLPDLDPAHMVYAIEAFVHATDAAGFFQQVAGLLPWGGRLFLIDDFLQTDLRPSEIERFEQGWRLSSLLPVNQVEQFAAAAGLEMIEHLDLTPFLNLGRPRDRFIRAMLSVPGVLRLNPTYLRALDGGDALQTCLKRGWIGYKLVGFQKR